MRLYLFLYHLPTHRQAQITHLGSLFRMLLRIEPQLLGLFSSLRVYRISVGASLYRQTLLAVCRSPLLKDQRR